jgi:hypothetical protein
MVIQINAKTLTCKSDPMHIIGSTQIWITSAECRDGKEDLDVLNLISSLYHPVICVRLQPSELMGGLITYQPTQGYDVHYADATFKYRTVVYSKGDYCL